MLRMRIMRREHERNWGGGPRRPPPLQARGTPACAVGEQDNVLGQQKVNKAAPRHSTRLELFQPNQAGQPAIPNSYGRSASTLNPKVEGSNPSRPITVESPAASRP